MKGRGAEDRIESVADKRHRRGVGVHDRHRSGQVPARFRHHRPRAIGGGEVGPGVYTGVKIGGQAARSATDVENILVSGRGQSIQNTPAPRLLRVRHLMVPGRIPIRHQLSVQSIPPPSAVVSRA